MSYDAKRLAFYGEYVHQDAKTHFLINFYTIDSSIEMYDLKHKKLFLRRTKVPDIISNDLFVGATINIFGKTILVSDYGDLCTRRQLTEKRQKTFIMILPGALNDIANIVIELDRNRLIITNLEMIQLEALEIVKFCSNNDLEQNLPIWLDHLSSDPVVAIQIHGDNAIEQVNNICGPDNMQQAKENYPNSLRAKYGVDSVNSGVFCSYSLNSSIKNLDFFFSKESERITFKSSAKLEDSALLIIKPHAIKEKNAGNIILLLCRRFRITAMKMMSLGRKQTEDFFEIYRGVIPEFLQMVETMTGPCLAVELIALDLGINTQQSLREFCGPSDPEVAKVLRPDSIRAIYGVSKILNAVHCTDLIEETTLELEKLFRVSS